MVLISSFVNRYSGKNAPTPVIAALNVVIILLFLKKKYKNTGFIKPP
jgi:hypothetical protein